MERNTINAISPVGERFTNLVSSGVITAIGWMDESGERHSFYECGANKEAVNYLNVLRNVIKDISRSTAAPWKGCGSVVKSGTEFRGKRSHCGMPLEV